MDYAYSSPEYENQTNLGIVTCQHIHGLATFASTYHHRQQWHDRICQDHSLPFGPRIGNQRSKYGDSQNWTNYTTDDLYHGHVSHRVFSCQQHVRCLLIAIHREATSTARRQPKRSGEAKFQITLRRYFLLILGDYHLIGWTKTDDHFEILP